MASPAILDRVRHISADIFEVPAPQITADSSPQTLELWDSVRHLNLVLALEEQFDLSFAPEEIDQMKSISKIADLVTAKLRDPGGS